MHPLSIRACAVGRGAYRHVKAPLPNCGCDVEVQTFLAAAAHHVGASSIIALAMKVGNVIFYLKADLQLQVVGSNNDQTLQYSAAGSSTFFSGLLAEKVSPSRPHWGGLGPGYEIRLIQRLGARHTPSK